MKTITSHFIRFLAVASILCISCENYTEVDLPQSQLTGESVYENSTTAKAALADIYARIRDGGVLAGTQFGGTPLLANYSDDFVFYGESPDIEQFSNHTIEASNYFVAVVWDNSYGQLYALNAFLQGVENSAFISEEDKSQFRGEGLFLRAYLNFYLVNLFGAIPYVTSIDHVQNSVIGRTPAVEVYMQIINDLLEAETLVSDIYPSAERVRPSKAAVRALLARVFLYTESYAEAEAKATSVLSDSQYSLDTNLADAFLKKSPAIILAAHSGIAGQNTHDAASFLLYFGPPFKSALSENLYNSFEQGDTRKNEWVGTVVSGTSSWYYAKKYRQDNPTSPSAEYTIWLGLAEQYLIRAEARARMGNILGAQDDLNVIRSRAGLSGTTASNPQELVAAVLRERRVELFTEQSHRWFDLKRLGTAAGALSGLKPGWRETDILLPIPEKELLLNKNLLPQNPGY